MVALSTHSPPPMGESVKQTMPSDSDDSPISDGDSTDQANSFKTDYENWGTLRRGNRMLATYTMIPHIGKPNKYGQAQPATLTSIGARTAEDSPTILEPADIRKIMEADDHDLMRKHGEVFYKTKALKGILKPGYMWVALEKNPETGNLYLPGSVLDRYCPLWRIILAYKGNLKAFDDGKPPVNSPEPNKRNSVSWFKPATKKQPGHQDDLAVIVKELSLDLKEIKGDIRQMKNIQVYAAEAESPTSFVASVDKSPADASDEEEVEVEKSTGENGPITPPPDEARPESRIRPSCPSDPQGIENRSIREKMPEPVALNKNADSAQPPTNKRNRSSVREEVGSASPQNQGDHACKRRNTGRTHRVQPVLRRNQVEADRTK